MKKIPTFVPVVAVALIRYDGKILLQQRRLDGAHGGLWEFPGGKIEPDESAESALIREIREELGCEIALDALTPLTFASDTRLPPALREPYVILLYTCRDWQGEPQCLDGEAIGWFAADELAGLSMPPLDRPLSEALIKAI
ncbi:MAG TPA: (deoxy)nucleoside triphosphate pyrophosphohydrolase [Novosphingobium sp.]|nr:(deoxy)nucleoside triphosphate pyrophosphohydrolase [Novosphingobium sp.]